MNWMQPNKEQPHKQDDASATAATAMSPDETTITPFSIMQSNHSIDVDLVSNSSSMGVDVYYGETEAKNNPFLHSVRLTAGRLVLNRWYKRFVVLMILLTTVLLITKASLRNQFIDAALQGCLIFFTMEGIMAILHYQKRLFLPFQRTPPNTVPQTSSTIYWMCYNFVLVTLAWLFGTHVLIGQSIRWLRFSKAIRPVRFLSTVLGRLLFPYYAMLLVAHAWILVLGATLLALWSEEAWKESWNTQVQFLYGNPPADLPAHAWCILVGVQAISGLLAAVAIGLSVHFVRRVDEEQRGLRSKIVRRTANERSAASPAASNYLQEATVLEQMMQLQEQLQTSVETLRNKNAL